MAAGVASQPDERRPGAVRLRHDQRRRPAPALHRPTGWQHLASWRCRGAAAADRGGFSAGLGPAVLGATRLSGCLGSVRRVRGLGDGPVPALAAAVPQLYPFWSRDALGSVHALALRPSRRRELLPTSMTRSSKKAIEQMRQSPQTSQSSPSSATCLVAPSPQPIFQPPQILVRWNGSSTATSSTISGSQSLGAPETRHSQMRDAGTPLKESCR